MASYYGKLWYAWNLSEVRIGSGVLSDMLNRGYFLLPQRSFLADEPLEAVIREAIKGGTAVPRTSIPSETPLGYVDLMETCYSFSPDFRPNFKCADNQNYTSCYIDYN